MEIFSVQRFVMAIYEVVWTDMKEWKVRKGLEIGPGTLS